MTIRLLGTGGADGIPGFFANDEVSRYAREQGGKELRSRAAAIIGSGLKIDLPPETFNQLVREGLDARDWTGLFFTHSHEDHCAVSELQYALYPFVSTEALPFTIFGNSNVLRLIRTRYPDWPLDLVETKSFEPIQHGPYTITPIEANHIEGEDCHNLIVEREGKRLLYATDTGVWGEKTFDYLSHQSPINLLVIECTDGFVHSAYQGHLNIDSCVTVVNRLREMGVLHPDAAVVTTHHSHSGKATHIQLIEALGKHRIEPGYDGLLLEV